MSSLISSLVVRISAEGAAACPRPASGWVGPSLLVSGLMLAWPLCGLAQPQTPPQAPPTVSVRVAPGMAAAEEMLSLPAFLQRARQSNKSVAARRSEAEIASTAVQRAQGAFETQATLSSSVGATRQANTKEEELIRRGGIYDRESADLSATVSRLLGTGTRIEGKATLSRFLTNVSNDQEYRTYFGVTLTHPLARDSGQEAALARVKVAEAEVAGAQAAARDTEGSTVAESIFAYWDLVLAQHRAAHAAEKVTMGERLLAQAQALRRQGRIPDSQAWDVENDLIRYRAAVVEAQVAQAEAINRVARLLAQALQPGAPGLRAVDPLPDAPRQPPDAQQILARALEARPDLRQRFAALERERIQAGYAANQARPKLDLVASYGVNGGPGSSQAASPGFLKDFPSWSLGVQMAMPLGGNQQARADIQAARLRLSEAQRQIDVLRTEIANDVATGLALLAGAAQRWEFWAEISRREERQVQLERQRLESGRSDVRELLFREERAINARMAVVEQQVAWAKADALVEAAQGTLLERHR